ncbi:MAG: sugar phosphate isomerase/epimerase [Oscillospiraceae bacterium]|nr:sugar phosphate isomerase/epimerase [Oscillospiraceae bacterium]
MNLGFLTVCLGNMPLREKAEFAAKTRFTALEVAAWPKRNDRDYSSCDIDAENLTQQEADEIKKYMAELGLEISSLAYYDNNLHSDPALRAAIGGHLRKVIDAAAMLGVELVGTFVGRNSNLGFKENFDEFQQVFGGHVKYAKSKGVKIMIENCQMFGWLGDGYPGTISHTPEQFREMFRRVPDDNFGLNFDPSHFVPQYIDYIKAIDEFKDRIFHFHAKDAEILPENLYSYGVYNRRLNHDDNSGYWRYRMPSLGQVDWDAVISHLKAAKYDGTISIEHEDRLYEGTAEKVKEGLELGYKFLSELV